MQSYEVLHASLQEVVARVFPWLELLLGVFVVLGLWTRFALQGIFLLVLIFIIVVSQALIRGLAVTECGCFGELLSFPLHITLMLDGLLFLLLCLLWWKSGRTAEFSLDKYFS